MSLAFENLCLRQQLAVLKRQRPHPRIEDKDRRFWILVFRWFSRWRECLVIVQPETVLNWHRRGYRYYRRWRAGQRRVGRKRIPLEVRQLIRRMAAENPLWGQVRIGAELLKTFPIFGISCHVERYFRNRAGDKGIKAARSQYDAWLEIARHAHWRQPTDVTASYPKASILKGGRVVFNIKGNDYRLVAALQYQAGVLVIRFFGTHAEYDRIDAETV